MEKPEPASQKLQLAEAALFLHHRPGMNAQPEQAPAVFQRLPEEPGAAKSLGRQNRFRAPGTVSAAIKVLFGHTLDRDVMPDYRPRRVENQLSQPVDSLLHFGIFVAQQEPPPSSQVGCKGTEL
jgi:hypothetical protein